VWSAAISSRGAGNGRSAAFEYLASLGSAPAAGRGLAVPRIGKPSIACNGRAGRRAARPVFQSDASRLACLRSDWSPRANSLVLSHHLGRPAIELAARGRLLLSGGWDLDLSIDGEPVVIDGPWTCGCWFSDEDADYCELQVSPRENVRVERQILLTRRDDLLFLADVVIAPAGARIDCAARIPLAPGVAAAPGRTRACELTGRAVQARVFPVALPRDRVHSAAGQLTAADGAIELRQSATTGLYAPLVFDWNARRARGIADWRTLTVARDGSAMAAGEAVGYRLKTAGRQWLIYRSLSRILEPRTVLGHHTMYETVIARFGGDGRVEPIVNVEQSAAKS
jgi:hypothetical protein